MVKWQPYCVCVYHLLIAMDPALNVCGPGFSSVPEMTCCRRWSSKCMDLCVFSILNSVVIVLFLSGMVAMIMLRTLHKDIARYNQMDDSVRRVYVRVFLDILTNSVTWCFVVTFVGRGPVIWCCKGVRTGLICFQAMCRTRCRNPTSVFVFILLWCLSVLLMHVLTLYVTTFRVRHSRGETYSADSSLCLCVCLSLAAFPHYCTDPDVTWGNGRGCSVVVHCWADLQSVHGFHCFDNVAPNAKCQRVLVLALSLVSEWW